jgi:hypothetical protein
MKLEIRSKVVKPAVGTETSTYVRLNDPWRLRFKVLANKAGYVRAENDLGVSLFVQALTAAALEYIRQTDTESYDMIQAANATGLDAKDETNAVWFYDFTTGKVDGKQMREAVDKANAEAAPAARKRS